MNAKEENKSTAATTLPQHVCTGTWTQKPLILHSRCFCRRRLLLLEVRPLLTVSLCNWRSPLERTVTLANYRNRRACIEICIHFLCLPVYVLWPLFEEHLRFMCHPGECANEPVQGLLFPHFATIPQSTTTTTDDDEWDSMRVAIVNINSPRFSFFFILFNSFLVVIYFSLSQPSPAPYTIPRFI